MQRQDQTLEASLEVRHCSLIPFNKALFPWGGWHWGVTAPLNSHEKSGKKSLQAVMNSEILPKWKEVEEIFVAALENGWRARVFLSNTDLRRLWSVGDGAKTNQPTNYLRKKTLSIEMDNVSWMFHCFGGMCWKHLLNTPMFSALNSKSPSRGLEFWWLPMTRKTAAKWMKGDAGINTTCLVGACQPIPILFGKGLWWSFRDFALIESRM